MSQGDVKSVCRSRERFQCFVILQGGNDQFDPFAMLCEFLLPGDIELMERMA